MKDSKWKRLFQQEIKRDAKSILEEVNNDPNLKDVEAPEIIHARLRKDLQLGDVRLTAEERELIRLGTRYKKRRSFTKYAAVAAAAVFILAFGITSTGAGEKMIEKVQWWIANRMQIHIDTGKDIVGADGLTEDEAYTKIEEVFGVYPVKRSYLPKDMVFSKAVIDEELQNARLYYKQGNEKWICYTILFQYRTASAGIDTEDDVSKRTQMEVQGTRIYITKYDIEDGKTRCRVEFEYQKVYYSVLMIGLTDQEVENFVKNLKFF